MSLTTFHNSKYFFRNTVGCPSWLSVSLSSSLPGFEYRFVIAVCVCICAAPLLQAYHLSTIKYDDNETELQSHRKSNNKQERKS